MSGMGAGCLNVSLTTRARGDNDAFAASQYEVGVVGTTARH